MGNMSKLGASMSTMMGMNDYGFLYTTGSVRFMSTMRVKSRQSGMGDGDEDVKRPSIDDFDSEISIFKVFILPRVNYRLLVLLLRYVAKKVNVL